MAYCVFTNCLSILGSGITPYTSLDSRSGVSLTSNGQMLFVGSSDNSGPLGMVFQHINSFGVCRADITSTRYGISGNDLSINVDSSDPDTAGGLYIKYRGNVGIGTSSPSTKLNIRNRVDRAYTPNSFNDTLHALHIEFCNQNQRAGLIRFTSHGNLENSFGVVQVGCAASGCGQGDFVFQAYKEAGGSGYNELMRLTNAGRVGIGTSSPTPFFQVCGNQSGENVAWVQNTNSNGYGSLRALNNLNCAAVFGVGGSDVGAPYANTGYLYTDPNVNFVFSIGTTEKMRITSAGNVGIACASPGAKLTVGGTLTTTDTITTTSGTVNTIVSWNASVGIIGTDTNHGLQIRTCGTERIRVTCAGCVGIGTTTPSYNLHVNGTFYAAGSSQDYKEGICKYDTDSCMFMKLKPVTYQYKQEFKHLGKELKSQTQIGLIAEEVAEVAPELAILVKENDNDVVRNVDYEKLTIVLLSEVQKLRKELDDLKTK